MLKLNKEEVFSLIRKLHNYLPDRDKLLYLKELTLTITKYTGGKIGQVSINCVEIYEYGKTMMWDRIFK